MTTHRRLLSAVTPFAAALALVPGPCESATVFLNELHYDNVGGDVGELVEVAGEAGVDLSGWSIALYNGDSGATYGDVALSGILPDEGAGYGAIAFPVAGLQNGAPDGLALLDDAGAVVELLSYEGSFAATAGPAAGLVSADLGVAETGTDAPGLSLQRTGTGLFAPEFVWTGPNAASPGFLNVDQAVLIPAPVPLPASAVTLVSALLLLTVRRLFPRAGAGRTAAATRGRVGNSVPTKCG
jgi:hypothetical protein